VPAFEHGEEVGDLLRFVRHEPGEEGEIGGVGVLEVSLGAERVAVGGVGEEGGHFHTG